MMRQRAHLWLNGMASDLDRVAHAFTESCRRFHLVALSVIFDRLPRLVRDVAKRKGKMVQLEISGGEIEIDDHSEGSTAASHLRLETPLFLGPRRGFRSRERRDRAAHHRSAPGARSPTRIRYPASCRDPAPQRNESHPIRSSGSRPGRPSPRPPGSPSRTRASHFQAQAWCGNRALGPVSRRSPPERLVR